jgi:hypothetical protein
MLLNVLGPRLFTYGQLILEEGLGTVISKIIFPDTNCRLFVIQCQGSFEVFRSLRRYKTFEGRLGDRRHTSSGRESDL